MTHGKPTKIFKGVIPAWTQKNRDSQKWGKKKSPLYPQLSMDKEPSLFLKEKKGLLRGKDQAAENNVLGNQFQRARLGPNQGIFPAFRVGEPENMCPAGFQSH